MQLYSNGNMSLDSDELSKQKLESKANTFCLLYLSESVGNALRSKLPSAIE